MQSHSECLAIAVCVHVCACSGDGSSCLLELHTVLDVQSVEVDALVGTIIDPYQ